MVFTSNKLEQHHQLEKDAFSESTPLTCNKDKVARGEENALSVGEGPTNLVAGRPTRTRRTKLNIQDMKEAVNHTSTERESSKHDISPEIEFNPDGMNYLIPIMVKTDLPEFKHLESDGPTLADKNLKWFEFVVMYSRNPNDYILRGDDGRVLELESKIGEYIDVFKQEASSYLVLIEKGTQNMHKNSTSKLEENSELPGPVRKSLKPKRKSPRRRSSKRKRTKLLPNTIENSKLETAIPLVSLNCSNSELHEQLPKQDQYFPASLPNMKPNVMNFVKNKVSNRDMLRIREELIQLKGEEDYFKLTALTPLTAGLLEQMLCRSLPIPSSLS